MNKRQRKKHHLAEFTQWGFSIEGLMAEGANAESNDAFMNSLLGFVDGAGLDCGGGCNRDTFGFVVFRYQTHGSTDADRDLMDEFLMSCKHVKEYKVSKLFDVNRKDVED